MSNSVTIQDIYQLFQASQAEADRRLAKLERLVAELAEDRKRRSEEADRRATQADRDMQQLKKVVANTSREVANLTSRWGQFLENLVEPAVVRLFQARGIAVTETHRRVKTKRSGIAMEIDILAIDDDVAVAVEVKSRLSKTDVDYFLDKLARFKEAFPRYTDVKLNGAVAGIEIDEGIDRYAYRRGLFVIQQSGEVVEIANDEAFRPGVW
ncbi:MAG: YraN family protein [Prochloron sp. SP5CPC1]|nr:YraN family protein [Candidatus Paraprochloron terpiosi SP5CPC1]